MNNGNFPNFHTLGLLRVTDVVSLSSFPKEADPNPGLDRVYFDLIKDLSSSGIGLAFPFLPFKRS